MLERGARLDRYTLLDLLGEGGQGEVWRARDELDGGLRALKLVRVALTKATQLERMRREARALAELDHPSLVRCYGLFEDVHQGVFGLVMDYVPGASLWVKLDDPRLTAEARVHVLRHLAAVLAHLHSKRLVHRDLKLANVLLDDRFWEAPHDSATVKLVDFGIATVESNPNPLTGTGNVIGTPPFLAPELLLPSAFGEAKAGPTADIFAYGVLGWLLLADRHPTGLPMSSGLSEFAMAYRDAAAGDRPWPELPEGNRWYRILARCLVPHPGRRISNGNKLCAELAAVREVPNTYEASPGPPPSIARPASSSKGGTDPDHPSLRASVASGPSAPIAWSQADVAGSVPSSRPSGGAAGAAPPLDPSAGAGAAVPAPSAQPAVSADAGRVGSAPSLPQVSMAPAPVPAPRKPAGRGLCAFIGLGMGLALGAGGLLLAVAVAWLVMEGDEPVQPTTPQPTSTVVAPPAPEPTVTAKAACSNCTRAGTACKDGVCYLSYGASWYLIPWQIHLNNSVVWPLQLCVRKHGAPSWKCSEAESAGGKLIVDFDKGKSQALKVTTHDITNGDGVDFKIVAPTGPLASTSLVYQAGKAHERLTPNWGDGGKHSIFDTGIKFGKLSHGSFKHVIFRIEHAP